MASEPRWLTADEVADLNAAIVASTGEPFVVRDRGLLESASGKPLNLWTYGDKRSLAALAAALLLGITRNHPFAQGNKRTGFEAAVLFLEANGYDLDASDNVAWAELIIGVTDHSIDEGEIALFIEIHLKPTG